MLWVSLPSFTKHLGCIWHVSLPKLRESTTDGCGNWLQLQEKVDQVRTMISSCLLTHVDSTYSGFTVIWEEREVRLTQGLGSWSEWNQLDVGENTPGHTSLVKKLLNYVSSGTTQGKARWHHQVSGFCCLHMRAKLEDIICFITYGAGYTGKGLRGAGNGPDTKY